MAARIGTSRLFVTGQLLAWAPKLAPRGAGARAFASFGSAVFIAGNFRSVGGARRIGLAAIDRTTAQPLPWRVDIGTSRADTGVGDLVVAGSVLYLAGDFSSVSGTPQANLAAVRLSD